MFRATRNTFRLLRIATVLARHDALFSLEETRVAPVITTITRLIRRRNKELRKGQRLANALTELGPSFIKLGQALSTRSDFIGDDIARDLTELQDNIPPFPTAQARRIIEESLGEPVETLFEHFEDTPVAAASIAQVYFAKTRDGKDVAVKILRPDIHKAFERDLDLFYWIAELIERRLPSYRRMKPQEMVHTLGESVAFELDLRYEAAAAVELKKNTRDDKGFYVPTIYWEYTSEYVLTLERIYGIPVSNLELLRKEGYDFGTIAYNAASTFFNQVFRDGFFHADPHPGNVFILHDHTIAVVDFGIMGRLERKDRIFLAEVLYGFLTEDYERVARVHKASGIVPPHKSEEHFALACRAIAKPILDKPLNEISVARLLGQLFQISETFEMQLQPQLLLLQKTMMLTEGVGRSFKPDMNMWKMVEPLIKDWAKENLSARAQMKHTVEETAQRLRKLPEILDKAERTLNRLAEMPEKTEEDVKQSARMEESHLVSGILIATLAAVVSGFSVWFAMQ